MTRWFAEKWTNQRGETVYKKPGDIYRPNIKITNHTPKTFSELTNSQILKASNVKKSQGRVKKF